ncbi:hypothetical protein ACVZDL_23390 (plasmid) [Escherichia coli]
MKKGKTLEPGLLASDSDWHNNACLNYMPDHGTAYTEGYRRAADILINHIDESGRDQDFLVYPVLFLYRHLGAPYQTNYRTGPCTGRRPG